MNKRARIGFKILNALFLLMAISLTRYGCRVLTPSLLPFGLMPGDCLDTGAAGCLDPDGHSIYLLSGERLRPRQMPALTCDRPGCSVPASESCPTALTVEAPNSSGSCSSELTASSG